MQRYDITGMSCAACAGHVEKAVAAVPGVASVTVSLLTNSMQVDYTPMPTLTPPPNASSAPWMPPGTAHPRHRRERKR